MKSHPDVQLGKLFIILWMGLMLLIIILILVAYFNAKKEASDCDPKELDIKKSEKASSMGTTPIIFIVFIAITFLAVSTMNLTYKVNYFTKKGDTPEITDSSSAVLDMLNNATQQDPKGGPKYSLLNSNTENE